MCNKILFPEEGGVRKEFFTFRHFKSSWNDGGKACYSNGMEFVSLDTISEYHKLESLVAHLPVNTYLYIGAMTSHPRPNIWKWMNSGQPMTYQIKWWPTEPTNTLELCLMMERANGNQLQAHDIDCLHYFQQAMTICQKKTNSNGFVGWNFKINYIHCITIILH